MQGGEAGRVHRSPGPSNTAPDRVRFALRRSPSLSVVFPSFRFSLLDFRRFFSSLLSLLLLLVGPLLSLILLYSTEKRED